MFQFLRFGYQMSIRVHSASTVQVLAIHGRIVTELVALLVILGRCGGAGALASVMVVMGQEVKEISEVSGYQI